MGLEDIDYKGELYLAVQLATKRHKEACQRLRRKRIELPLRDSDPAQILEWALVRQDVSKTLKEKNKVEDAYNASIRSNLSMEQLGLERFEAIRQVIENQNRIDSFKAQPEISEIQIKIANAFEKASQGVKPEDLAEPRDGLYEFISLTPSPEPTEEERAVAAKERENIQNLLDQQNKFNTLHPSEGIVDRRKRIYKELRKAGISDEEAKKVLDELEGKPKSKE